jgi:guanylate kinase
LTFVLFGAGGVGKGTIADRLVSEDPHLRLSRSWTTRARRPGEADDAYTFVDRATFEAHVRADGFFEWAEFLGNLYGTPLIEPDGDRDVLLEIDLQGALTVHRLRPDAALILLKAPSPDAQEARLRARGDDEAHIQKRLRAGAEEERRGEAIADAVVVNHDVAQATAEVAGIVERYRLAAQKGGTAARGPAGGAGSSPHRMPGTAPDDLAEGS